MTRLGARTRKLALAGALVTSAAVLVPLSTGSQTESSRPLDARESTALVGGNSSFCGVYARSFYAALREGEIREAGHWWYRYAQNGCYWS